MTEHQPQPRREVPAWVFLVIILLCVGGGIAFVVWYFRTPNPISEQVVLKSAEEIAEDRAERRRDGDRRGNADRRAARSRIRMVSREGPVRTYRAATREITMHVRDVPRGDDVFTFRLPRGLNLLPTETQELAQLRWRILRENRVGGFLRITDEQREQLREMELSNNIVVSDENMKRMRGLWEQANPRRGGVPPQIEAQIMTLLRQIADDAEKPTRELWTRQLRPIEDILTPEQIQAYRQMGQPGAQRPPEPATQPAE